jgi:prevent-host-death family protein
LIAFVYKKPIIAIITTIKGIKMEILTAKQAKNLFGEALDMTQREPVLITKNKRPVCVMVSIEDIKGTHLADLFYEKEAGYDEFVQKKVTASLKRLENEGSKGKNIDLVHASIMEKVRLRLEGKK